MKKLASYALGLGIGLSLLSGPAYGMDMNDISLPDLDKAVKVPFHTPQRNVKGTAYYSYNGSEVDTVMELSHVESDGKQTPFYLWHDKNRNEKMDLGEQFYTPKMDGNWKVARGRVIFDEKTQRPYAR